MKIEVVNSPDDNMDWQKFYKLIDIIQPTNVILENGKINLHTF